MGSWLTVDELTDPETRLLAGLGTGESVDVAGVDGDTAPIRAVALFQILTGTGGLATQIIRRLDLRNAVIVGKLDLSEMTVEVPVVFTSCVFDSVLDLDRSTMRSLRFNDCQLEWGLRAEGAQIIGKLAFHGGSVVNPNRDALSMDQARITGGLYTDQGFTAKGEVSLTGTTIDGPVSLTGGKFTNPGGYALNMYQAKITGRLILPLNGADGLEGKLVLSDARVGILNVTNPREAPSAVLNGLTFDTVDPEPEQNSGDRAAWLDWLRRDPSGFRPGPYAALAGAFTTAGHENDAREVLIAGEDARYKNAPLHSRAWGWLKKWTVGYGFRPEWALGWLIVWLILGSLLLCCPFLGWWTNFTAPSLVGNDSTVPASDVTTPPLYLLDQLIPLIDLPQNLGVATTHTILTWGVIGYVMLGWALGIAAIAAIAKTLARE